MLGHKASRTISDSCPLRTMCSLTCVSSTAVALPSATNMFYSKFDRLVTLSLFPLPSLLRLCPSPPCSDHLPRARLFDAVRRVSLGRSVSPPMSLPRIQLLSAHPCLSLSSASTESAGAADALTVIHIPPLSTVLPTRPPRRPTCLPLRPRTSTLQSRLFLPPHGHPLALLYPLID